MVPLQESHCYTVALVQKELKPKRAEIAIGDVGKLQAVFPK